MFVRCEDCNYENLAQHSFCGMCGAKLPSPRRVAPTPTTVAEPAPVLEPGLAALEALPEPVRHRMISGPSLLGLGTEPTPRERVNYLLEDEPANSTWPLWAAVLVLAAAVGGAGWYWRTELRGWIARAPQSSAADANSAPATTAAAEPAPANPTPATSTPVAEGTPSSTPAQGVAPPEQAATPPAQPVTDAVARVPEAKEEKPSDLAASPDTTQPASPSVAPQPTKPKIVRQAPVTNASAEALETQGENYLYGHGVQADCGRAGKSLLAAAALSSPKAQSVLGTMYATGHCVTRDVPTAYRWFAKALHQDPGNVRIQRDLEVLWQQMTPDERQLAMKTGP